MNEQYTRSDIYRLLKIPDDKQGGDWLNGYHRHGDDWYIFANVGVAGRTGHDYPNEWVVRDGVRVFKWRGKTASHLGQPTIASLLDPPGSVLVFTRGNDRDPFTFEGRAKAVGSESTVPVTIYWLVDAVRVRAPEAFAEEIDRELREKLSPEILEGATKVVRVNRYERSAEARRRCIEHYGATCAVCGFDFKRVYGDLGQGFIHVHHVVPLAEIAGAYKVNPVRDLRPICPNCHAMIHRREPALSVEELRVALLKRA